MVYMPNKDIFRVLGLDLQEELGPSQVNINHEYQNKSLAQYVPANCKAV